MHAKSRRAAIRTSVFTLLALIAFAANSVLCRLALGDKTIDAASFTAIRLLSGALVLMVLLGFSRKGGSSTKGSWSATFMLFAYALTFSFAFISLDTATGALILFSSVQLTMILLSLVAGNRLQASEWLGVAVAFLGFLYLVLPGVTRPSLIGFALMTLAGISWAAYTLKGRGSVDPLADTAYNFARSIPLVLVLIALAFQSAHLSVEGIRLAVISGGLTSGIGYVIWYTALGGLSATQAAVVQLSVPVIAAFGGVILVAEPIGPRLVLAAVLILGGILMVILGRHYLFSRG
jgi:drug/metabolite transporter (DMT)-like permease